MLGKFPSHPFTKISAFQEALPALLRDQVPAALGEDLHGGAPREDFADGRPNGFLSGWGVPQPPWMLWADPAKGVKLAIFAMTPGKKQD